MEPGRPGVMLGVDPDDSAVWFGQQLRDMLARRMPGWDDLLK